MAERSNGCYKCGVEGHIARDCPTGGNDPRGGRNQRDRPPMVCYNCNKPGHIARECTEQSTRPERVDRGERGAYRGGDHGERDRGYGDRGGDRGYNDRGEGDRDRRGGDIQCYNCQKFGHMARECKKGRPMECYNCRKEGHIARDCPEGNTGGDRKKNLECHQCHEMGHFAAECPSKN